MGNKIEELITDDVKKLGYEIEYVEYVKEGTNNILRIVIDKENVSLTTEDCETVSHAVEEKIDSMMKGDNSYILEVSSPGLERALKNDRLYKKYLGSKVNVKLYKKYEDKKEIIGILKEVKEDSILIDSEGQEVEIEKKDIACGNTVYEF